MERKIENSLKYYGLAVQDPWFSHFLTAKWIYKWLTHAPGKLLAS